MPRSKVVRGNVPNMVQGVSQQAPALRLPAQSEEDINVHPLIVDGLIKRPPSRHEAYIDSNGSEFGTNTFFHFIFRDEAEQYIVSIESDGTLRVHDLEGNEKTVTDNSNGYLASLTDPVTEIHALTVADYTFITNKTKTVAERAAVKAARNPEGIINIKAGAYGRDYTVFVDGVNEAQYTTPDGGTASHSGNIGTTYIASQLYAALTDTGTGTEFDAGDWDIAQYKNVLWITNTAGTDFNLEMDDDYSGSLGVAVKDSVVNFSDLPRFNKEGFTVLVRGNNTDDQDDYWVEFEWIDDAGAEGFYKETLKPGSKLGFDADTMPHTLVRESDGTFTFGPASWSDRTVGDDTTNPNPSFVGQTIESVFFHKNRLGILTSENVVMSESRQFFNFFRQTMTAVLDTDPIDIAASHTKVSYLKHAVGFQDVMILFSDTTQFKLAGEQTLTPLEVSTQALTEMDCSELVAPVVSSSSMFFVSESEANTQLYEFFIDKAVETAEPVSVSSHVPSYIPQGARHIIAAPHYDTIFTYTAGDPDALFLYTYYVSDREKLQSAWCRWEFPGVTRIGTLGMYRSWLYMIAQRDNGKTYIERINIEQGQNEKVHLDRRYELIGGSYNFSTKKTRFTVPYTLPSNINLVTKGDGSYPLGLDLTGNYTYDELNGYIYIDGQYDMDTIYVGIPFDSKHTFSRFYYRDGRQNDRVSIQDGRLTIRRLDIFHGASAYFEVKVELDGRETRTYPFTGGTISDPNTLTGELITRTGRMSVPIMSRSDRCRISVENNTWRPFSLTSATWRGVFNPSNRQT